MSNVGVFILECYIHQTRPTGDFNRGSRARRVSNGKKCT